MKDRTKPRGDSLSRKVRALSGKDVVACDGPSLSQSGQDVLLRKIEAAVWTHGELHSDGTAPNRQTRSLSRPPAISENGRLTLQKVKDRAFSWTEQGQAYLDCSHDRPAESGIFLRSSAAIEFGDRRPPCSAGVSCCSQCSCATLLEVACEWLRRARAGQGESHADLRSSPVGSPCRSLALRPSCGGMRRSRRQ
jgi:hypothetical protein